MQTNARRAIAVTVLEQAPADVTGGLAEGRAEHLAAPATSEHADLVVVGAGLSGLAAAHFYRRRFGDARRVIVLDAAAHVGGMTRRVELDVDGRRLTTFGGAAAFNGPRSWASPVNAGFLAELGIDLAEADAAVPAGALGSATYFDAATFGSERVVPGALPVGDAPAAEVAAAAAVIARFPYAPEQRA